MWKIEVELENENKKSFSLEPSSTIGNLIHKLSETSENFNWSEFTLWNGEKNEWLDNPRNSLDQYQLYNGSKIQFLRTRLPIYIILPDFRIIRPIINMCSNILDVLKYVCELLGIRRYEEFSFIALHSTEDSSGSIGKDPKNKPKKGCEGSISLAKKIQEYFDRCELSEKKLVSYFDIEIPQYTADIFPNSNSLSDWCGLYENLVVSSWPLKNKDFSNDDILYLRFRYANFLDLNPRTDPVRFAFAFAYAAYAMKTQELKCEQEELLDLAAILWQVVMIQEKLIKVQDDSDSHNMVENIDNALDALEVDFNKPHIEIVLLGSRYL
ncbi:hypothetical protein HZS_5903 [Henneguya salminicola]|nr:hypothetical protein HZS_5903 [Henneguya salminicola]